jgi:LuxR family maltose regulon positive regulatory protein
MDGTVRRWLAGFPSDFLRESAPLSAISAVTALFAGDGTTALRWSQYLSRLVVLRHDGSGSVEAATLWSEALRAFVETRRASELVEPAARAHSNLPGGTWHAFACLTLGGVRFLAGDAGCVEVLEEGAFEAQLAGATLLRANCIAALAIIGDLQGDRDTLRRAKPLMVDLLKTHCSHTSPGNALVTAMQALAEARDVRRESAVRLIAASRRHLAGYAPVAPWFNVLARMALVRAGLLIDDPATARELLREIDHHLRFEVDGSSADGHVEQLRESVAAANKLLAERSWSLTAAELKVVHYLPSNLNLGDIATRLFVSRNTVKSHVSSIYRKLGTTSRSRAVELAREAGFLNDHARDLL